MQSLGIWICIQIMNTALYLQLYLQEVNSPPRCRAVTANYEYKHLSPGDMRLTCVADLKSKPGAFLTLESGIRDKKNPDLGSGIRNKHPRS